MSFAGPTSPTLQAYMRSLMAQRAGRVTVPAILFGSSRDPMLVSADQFARDLFERCELAITDESRPFANHALPEEPLRYAPIVHFLERQ